MSVLTVSPGSLDQPFRWLRMFNAARNQGDWENFDAQYRSFVGLVHSIASDSAATSILHEVIGSNAGMEVVLEVTSAIDGTVSGVVNPSEQRPWTPVFTPPHSDLDSRAMSLASFINRVPRYLDKLLESREIIDRSLRLRDVLKQLFNTSADFENPALEAVVLYVYGTLLSNTSPVSFYGPLVNPSSIPFYFQLLYECGDSFLNLLSVRQAKAVRDVRRPKSEKFGILDSPTLLAGDLSASAGTLGTACIYCDIDNFKALNTRFSERVVDRDILPHYQRVLSASVANLGFAYAEGGDESTILLPNATLNMAIAFVDGLRRALSQRVFSVESNAVQLRMSVGIAHAESGEDRNALPECANMAMRRAKESGKDRACVHSNERLVASRFEFDPVASMVV